MSNQIRPLLSLVIPAYNEADRLPATLRRIEEHRRSWDFSSEIIIVVEPSEDGTLALAENAAKSTAQLVVLTHHERRGKGFAVRSGMLRARGNFVFFTDADLSTPVEDLEASLLRLRKDPSVDVIVGNRQHPESRILLHQNLCREWMGKFFNRIAQKVTGLKIRDTQCGFKGFRHRAANEIFGRQRIDGFSFDVEVLLLAQAMGFSTLEVPVHWTNSPTSRVRVLHDSVGTLGDLFRIRHIVSKTLREFPYKKTAAAGAVNRPLSRPQ
ncbi:MAG: glycosyltransferase family 2 protein [Verrucomicrobia bacterium]|nr:glycosyltransferase family 2 protein [Verrucomicrobiota bacterium]MBV9299272.1 glycosyltransferase family 2 protein [Verrucomicrobiota bacterium]MBV9644474.1 glycosyltransferase family 2 protein [Verrucomicrobiota bacterium]